jgi:hypothetical protein
MGSFQAECLLAVYVLSLNAAPNNSFNRSANSVAFMRETLLIIMARRARLIRALCRCLYPDLGIDY